MTDGNVNEAANSQTAQAQPGSGAASDSAAALHPCPKCGKPMSEQKKGSGLWTCPDFKTPINHEPPYQFKCTGMEVEAFTAKDFEETCWKIIQRRN
jgi:ribosomal protein L37AE/L43A